MPGPEQDLPPDGTEVVATTYESLSDDVPARAVRGALHTRPSPFGGRQCWVGPLQVDPETIRPVEGESTD